LEQTLRIQMARMQVNPAFSQDHHPRQGKTPPVNSVPETKGALRVKPNKRQSAFRIDFTRLIQGEISSSSFGEKPA
jgi:hypothetical protein